MTYHVITPFSRFRNLPRLLPMLDDAGVQWHPIFDDYMPRMVFPERWIHPLYAPAIPTGWFPGHWLVNYFLDHWPITDDHRYLVLTDDDFYEPGFFDKLSRHTEDILICSMKRGHRTPRAARPESEHGTNTLIAAPENAKTCYCGLEQLILGGKYIRQVRLESHFTSDGKLIEHIVATWPGKIAYVPDAFVWFNYLEPGRWDSEAQTA